MKKIFALLTIILFSCDNEIPIEDNFVVEAFLFQGEKVDDVRIKETKLWNSEDSIDTYIGNAKVKLYGNGSEYNLEYNSIEGNYFTDDDLEIISGNTYGIEVNVDDRKATAETVVPTKPIGLKMSDYKIVIRPLVLSPALPNKLSELFQSARTNVLWNNSDEEYHYLTIKYVGEGEDPNYGKYKVTLYKINKDYYSLFESDVQDGTELNEPPSNIINAFGVFSAFASDTTSFEIVRE